MATLTDADYQYIYTFSHGNRPIWDSFRTWGLTRSTWCAAFQAVEDYMVAAYSAQPTTGIRAAIEAVTGATTSQRAQYVFICWVAWRIRHYLEGGA